jgi:predicted FMN-binding regulatory protein PaiB
MVNRAQDATVPSWDYKKVHRRAAKYQTNAPLALSTDLPPR